jgi:hypothetical protein
MWVLVYNVIDSTQIHFQKLRGVFDTPPNSLRDPNVGPKVKHRKKKRIGACFLAHSTSRVGGHNLQILVLYKCEFLGFQVLRCNNWCGPGFIIAFI